MEEWEKIAMREGWHSDEFVVMFLGYLVAQTPELHQIESPRILETWYKFKREMSSRPK
jgi:hypothetical protein